MLGRDEVLPALSQVPVVPLTTQIRGLPWEVGLTPADGLPEHCVLKPEWIRSVEAALLGPLIASFPDHRWSELRAALLDALGFARGHD